MPRFGKLLFVALLYKRCIGCKQCIGFGVSFQRKIRRNQLLESYGKNIFPTFTSAAINFCTWKPKLLGLGICNVPNFCQTGFRNFSNCLQVPRKCFSCTPKSYLYPNKWKTPIREGEFKGFCCGLEATKIITLSGTSLSSRQFSKMLKTKFMQNTESSI